MSWRAMHRGAFLHPHALWSLCMARASCHVRRFLQRVFNPSSPDREQSQAKVWNNYTYAKLIALNWA